MKINWIGVSTQYWKNAGGLQLTRTDAKRLEIVEKYAAEFYGLVKMVMRKNGKPDLKYVAKPKPTNLTLPAHLQASPTSSES